MKKLILMIMTVIVTSHGLAFAEWKNAKDVDYENVNFNLTEHLTKTDKQFQTPACASKRGVHICAIDKDLNHFVELRNVAGKVDYHIYLFEAVSSKTCELYLDLLDEDHFRLTSIKLDKLGSNFKGDVFGNFKMFWEDFKNVQYYTLSIRS